MIEPHPPSRPAIALRLDLTDWDSVLTALGRAAELTTVHIALTCDPCGSDAGSCPTHERDWDTVDHWRALSTTLRDQLTAQPPTQTTPTR